MQFASKAMEITISRDVAMKSHPKDVVVTTFVARYKWSIPLLAGVCWGYKFKKHQLINVFPNMCYTFPKIVVLPHHTCTCIHAVIPRYRYLRNCLLRRCKVMELFVVSKFSYLTCFIILILILPLIYILLSCKKNMKEVFDSCTMVGEKEWLCKYYEKMYYYYYSSKYDIIVTLFLMAGICSHTRKVQH